MTNKRNNTRPSLRGVPMLAAGRSRNDDAIARASHGRQSLLLAAYRRPVWFARSEAEDVLMVSLSGEVTAYYMDDEDSYSADSYEVTPEGVAVIYVCGPMLDEPMSWWMSWCDCCSTPLIESQMRHAADDANVKAIRVYFDTPGGQASGVYSAGQAFLYAREKKPVVAWAKSACSAGYWLASQCDSIEIRADSEVGCIGSVIRLSDWSKFYSQMGVTVDRITSTGAEKYKGMGATGTVITDEQKAEFKRIADEHQSLFNDAVASGRGMALEDVQTLADGRWYLGAKSLELGLADRITDFDASLAYLETVERRPLTIPEPPPDEGDGEDDDGETEESKPNITTEGLPVITQEALPISPTPLSSGDDTAATERTEEKPHMATIGERFNAFLASLGVDLTKPAPEGADPSQNAPTPPAAPVIDPKAALLELPEYKAFKEAQEKAEAEKAAAITSLREEVKATATTAYGIDTEAGKKAVASVHALADKLTDETALADLKQTCEQTATVSRNGRQSAAPSSSGGTGTDGTFLGAESEEQYDRVTALLRKSGTRADKALADKRDAAKKK